MRRLEPTKPADTECLKGNHQEPIGTPPISSNGRTQTQTMLCNNMACRKKRTRTRPVGTSKWSNWSNWR